MQKLITISTLIIALLFFHIGESKAQFTIENSTSAESIKQKPQVKINSTYSIEVINEALLKQQRRDKFNEKNYIEVNSSLTASQASFGNWAAGGDNSFSGRAALYARHVYRNNKFSNDIYLNTAYGLGENGDKLWKTEDRLELNNSLGYQMYNKWDYSMNFNFMSQFANGYAKLADSLPASSFLAPATINVSLGVSYTRNPKCKISLMPISGNVILVQDQRLADLGYYGDVGEKATPDVGAFVNITWEEPIYKEMVTYKTLASSFCDYRSAPSLAWQNWISVSVAKYINVSFYCYVIYDKAVTTPNGKPWQVNQTLGFGLSYIFKNRKKL